MGVMNIIITPPAEQSEGTRTMSHFLAWLLLTFTWIVNGPGVCVNGQQSNVSVIIDASPGLSVEQGTSVVLVCRVVGVLSSDLPTFSWTCPGSNCPSGTVREQDNVLLVDVIDSARHAGTYTCTVSVGGKNVSQHAELMVNSGIAFSLDSVFLPRNSLLADMPISTLLCHSQQASPMWVDSGNVTVSTNTSLTVHQILSMNTTELVVTNVSVFQNGVYQCMNSAGNMSSLGIFIRQPATANGTVMLMVPSSAMNSINLTWSVSSSVSVTGYFLSFKRTDISSDLTPQWVFIKGATTSHTLNNLLGGTNYDITLRLVDNFGVSNEESTNASTSEGTPTPPRQLTLVEGMDIVELNWLPPKAPNGVVRYTVQRTDGDGNADNETGIVNTSYPVTNQPSGTAFNFTVFAVTSAGDSEESNSVSFCNDTGVVAPNITAVMAMSSSSITVMWDAVTLCSGVSGYWVVHNDGTRNITMNLTMTAVNISNLPPFTNISVFVAVIPNNGMDGPAAMEVGTTLLEAPTITDNSSTATSIFASWEVDPNAVQYNVSLSHPTLVDMQQQPNDGTVTFEGLVPATTYTLTVRGVDSLGRDGDPTVVTITTDRTEPSVPQNLIVIGVTADSISVSWMKPQTLGDTSVNYAVTVIPMDVEDQTVTGLNAVISGLKAGTMYTISVSARNSVGSSMAVTVESMTLDQPAAVQGIVVTSNSSTRVQVNWMTPTAMGNTIIGYQIQLFIVDGNMNKSNQTLSVGNVNSTEVDMLSPGVPYIVQVAVNDSQRGRGLPGSSDVFFSEELEPEPGEVMVQNVMAQATIGNLAVTWDAVPLIQARRFFNYTVILRVVSSKRQAPISRTVASSCTSCNFDFNVDPGLSYTVQVGIDGFPSTLSSPTGPVPIPTASTPSTSPTTTITSPPSTEPDDTGVIVGIVIAGVVVIALLVGVLVVLFVFFCKSSGKRSEGYALRRSSLKYSTRDGTETSSAQNLISLHNLETDEQREQLVAEHTRIISLEEFPAYVNEMHKDRDQGYEEEYRLFRTDLVNTAKAALAIPEKNRYGNIFAYDHARVVMKDPDEEGCDYINASYLDGYGVKNAYIATQGPVPETIEDFWQMVWEQKSPVIVMLTRVDEGGRRKCEPYWPDTKEEPVVTKRGVRVTLTNIEPFADFEIRTLIVTSKKELDSPALEVKHFYYTVWPDHGVPQYATSVIKFIRRVRKFQSANPESTAPIIVHCSAGVGRSGTYICLDAMLQRMQREQNFNVFEFVNAMRDNRTYMVQTLDQYIFIHDAIHELIVCGDTSIPASSFRIKVNRLLKTLPDSTKTGFQHQFELLHTVSHVPSNAEISEGLADYNKPKNRDQDCIPYNLGRPRLLGVGFHTGADFINGSLVDGYKTRNYFIVTQGPLANTINDFWLMVWQNKSACIVMLCDTMEEDKECSAVYWSDQVGLNTVYGKITVTLKSSTEADGVVTRKFEVIEEGKAAPPLKVTQLHYKGWTESTCPKDHKPLLKVIGDMEKVQQATGNNPIVVMCSNGTGRSGAYVSIYAQIERMKVEGIVDLFQYIKLARLQRVNLVQTLDQYTFCHELMVSYLDSFEGYANFEFK